MILNKVDLVWDNEPGNLQMLNHFFFMVEDMTLRQVSLRLLFIIPSPPPFLLSKSFYHCSINIHSSITNAI
jgi:hypothetical protein